MKSRPLRSPREILARRVEVEGPRGLVRMALLAAVLLVLAYHLLFGDRGMLRLLSQRSQIQKLEQNIEFLQGENKNLERQLARLRQGKDDLEVRAREALGQVAEGEKIYRFVSLEETNLKTD